MSDETYLSIIIDRIRVCKRYKPRFGQGGSGLSLAEFQTLYSSDIFYSWFGLDTPMIYAAHRAAGGITSVYRQIGIGCEELFRHVLMDQLGLSAEQVKWSYTVQRRDGSKRTLSLDARIALDDIVVVDRRNYINEWLQQAAMTIGVAPQVASALKGLVFEVRQGYKSKDAKRQNADIANAATAYAQGYLPIGIVLSTQIDKDIIYRYEAANGLILLGYIGGKSTESTYTFLRDVIGYDLAAFFERHAEVLKAEIEEILEILLSTDDD